MMGSKWGSWFVPWQQLTAASPAPTPVVVRDVVSGGAGEDTGPLPAEEAWVAQLAGRGVETALRPGAGLHREDSGQALTPRPVGSPPGLEVEGAS